MGITLSEWIMLSLLLNYKSPNSRTSVLTLSDKIFPIKGAQEQEIKNIKEVKEILNSLERKGIIKIEEMLEHSEQKREAEILERGGNYRELERINLLYILSKIDALEYEKKFYELSSEIQAEGKRDIIPLTTIEKYISILKSLHEILKLVNPELSKRNSQFTNLENLELMIQRNVSQILEKIFNVFFRYLQAIKRKIEARPEKLVSIFIYLHPFLRDLIDEKKTLIHEKERRKILGEMEELKKSIELEKEVINVLKMLNEDEHKIRMHQDRLRALENKFGEMSVRVGEEGLVVRFPSSAMSFDWIKNKLMVTLGVTQSECDPDLERFIDDLSNLLYSEISKFTIPSKGDLMYHLPVHGILGEDITKRSEEDHCLLKVSLTWINDLCPIMLDSIIESDGRELTICRNLECFVVYHKRCLEKLLRTGANNCLVCNSPII